MYEVLKIDTQKSVVLLGFTSIVSGVLLLTENDGSK
jgi:hypothetical protein